MVKVIETEVEWWLSWAGGGETGELLFNGCRVSVWADEEALEMNGDGGCSTM